MQPHIKGAHNIFSNQVGIFEGIQRLGFKLYKLYGAILCVFSVVVYTSKATSVAEKNAGVLFCCQFPDNDRIFIFGWTHLFNGLSKTVNSLSIKNL